MKIKRFKEHNLDWVDPNERIASCIFKRMGNEKNK